MLVELGDARGVEATARQRAENGREGVLVVWSVGEKGPEGAVGVGVFVVLDTERVGEEERERTVGEMQREALSGEEVERGEEGGVRGGVLWREGESLHAGERVPIDAGLVEEEDLRLGGEIVLRLREGGKRTAMASSP